MSDSPQEPMTRHRPVVSRELGYATERCVGCGTFWPCAPARIQIARRNGTYEAGDWADADIADATR